MKGHVVTTPYALTKALPHGRGDWYSAMGGGIGTLLLRTSTKVKGSLITVLTRKKVRQHSFLSCLLDSKLY